MGGSRSAEVREASSEVTRLPSKPGSAVSTQLPPSPRHAGSSPAWACPWISTHWKRRSSSLVTKMPPSTSERKSPSNPPSSQDQWVLGQARPGSLREAGGRPGGALRQEDADNRSEESDSEHREGRRRLTWRRCPNRSNGTQDGFSR